MKTERNRYKLMHLQHGVIDIINMIDGEIVLQYSILSDTLLYISQDYTKKKRYLLSKIFTNPSITQGSHIDIFTTRCCKALYGENYIYADRDTPFKVQPYEYF